MTRETYRSYYHRCIRAARTAREAAEAAYHKAVAYVRRKLYRADGLTRRDAIRQAHAARLIWERLSSAVGVCV